MDTLFFLGMSWQFLCINGGRERARARSHLIYQIFMGLVNTLFNFLRIWVSVLFLDSCERIEVPLNELKALLCQGGRFPQALRSGPMVTSIEMTAGDRMGC